MSNLRWGILATGGIAHAFARDLRLAGLNLAAVGSRSQEKADAFASEFGIETAHGSYEALAADPNVDIVYVASPHGQHRADAGLVLEHGKHALIEKAFTLNEREARELQELAQQNKVLVTEAMWTRYLPHVRRIHEIIAAGTLGEVRAVIADHTRDLPKDPLHRLNNLELGGGALLDLGIYPISFAIDILGLPTEIKAVGSLGETGADTEVATAMLHANGATSSTMTTSRSAGPTVASIIGADARIDVDTSFYQPTTIHVRTKDGTELETFDGTVEGRGMQYEALAAEKAVLDGSLDTPELPIAETVAIMGVLDEVRRQVGVVYASD